MKNTILKVLEQKNNDRYVFITYSKDQIIGLNYHQGIGQIDYFFATPNIHLTEIFERLNLNKNIVTQKQKINKSISLYNKAFIFQD